MQIKKESLKERKNTISVSYRTFYITSALYILVPIIVFFFAWLKFYLAAIAFLLLGIAVFCSFRDCLKDNNKNVLDDKTIDVSILFIIVLAVISLFLSFSFGIGEYIWATDDHVYRRAIFRDMVNFDWPIVFDLSGITNPEVKALFPEGKAAFSYYFSFWMIPALIGKVFGFEAGNIALLIWSSIGIFLILLGMTMICKRQTITPMFAMVFFAGIDIIPYIYFEFFATKENWMWIEGYTEHIVYISNINNFLNVFNQCIPCYLIVVLLILSKNSRSLGLIAASMFAYSPWATIGVLPLTIYELFKKDCRTKDGKYSLKNIFSIGNIVPSIVMLGIFAPMYMANSSATSISGFTVNFYGGIFKFALAYLFVFVIEILPSFLLFGKKYMRNGLFGTAIGTLLIMPLYKITYQNDFTMRGAMPAFFVLTILFAIFLSDFACKQKEEHYKNLHLTPTLLLKSLIILLMSCVALTMFLVIGSHVIEGERINENIYSLSDIKDPEYAYVASGNFYVYDYEDTFFFKFMVKDC